MKTRINWKLLIVIVLAVTTIGFTAVMLRQYHRNRRAADGLMQGTAAFNQGRWQDAAMYLGQYIAVHQQDVPVLLKYAQSNARIQPPRRESLTQCVNAYRAILRIEDHLQAAVELTEIYLDFNMPAEAELVARRFCKTSDIRFQQYLAEALSRQRKFEAAVDVLMQLIGRQPDQVLAFELLGQIAEEQPDVSQFPAQHWFDQAVGKNPQAAVAYVLRSAFWSRQGRLQDALEDLRRAEQCPLDNVSDRLGIASAYIQHGRLKEAEAHLLVARQAEPNNLQVWQVCAQWAQSTGQPGQMRSIAEEALERLGWNNYAFLPIAGELFVLAGDARQAQQCLSALKEAGADRGVVLYLEGLIADLQMDWAQAIDRWQQAINLGYAAEPVYLNLAQTLDRIQNRSAAISLLRSHVNSTSGTFRGHILLGEMLLRENRFSEAMEQATAALQLKPSSLDAQVFYLHCRVLAVARSGPSDWTSVENRVRELIQAHDDVRTRMLLFEIALKKRDYVMAADVLDRGEKDLGENVQWVLARAELFKAQDKAAQVPPLLEKAKLQFPSSLDLIRALAAAWAAEHQYDKAAAILTQTLEQTQAPIDQRRLHLWLAEVEFMRGSIDSAVAIYEQLAARNPSDVYALRQLLSLKAESAAPAQLLQWIDQVRRAEGDNGWQWKYEQARYLYDKQPFETVYPEIVKLLEKNLVNNPDDQDSRILLASAYERANNIQLALSLYRQALAVRPDDVELIVAAVSLMYRAEEYRQAQQLLDRAIQQGVQDLRLTRFELQNSIRLGKMDAAVSSLERIILQSPRDYNARLTLGLLLIRKGDFDQAAAVIGALMRENPDSAAAVAAMADLHLSRSEKELALAVCDTFIQTHDTVTAHTLRAQVLLQIDRSQDALEEVQRIEFLASATPEKLAVIDLYRSIGDLTKANAMMHALLIEFPDDPAVQKQAALLFLEQPALAEQSALLLDKALRNNPADNELRLQQAQRLILRKTADALSEATQILDRMVYEMPRFETAWVLLGQSALLQKDPAVALNYVTRGLDNLPESRRLLLLKAQAQAMRSPENAIDTLEQMHQQTPLDTTVLRMLSEICRRSGRPDRAMLLLEEAFQYPEPANNQALQLEWIAAAYQSGRKEEAFAYVRKKTELTDGNEGFLAAWTGLLVKDGRWKDAVDVYDNWAARYPQKRDGILPTILDQLSSTGVQEAVDAGQRMVQSVLTDNPNSVTAIYSMAMLLHHSGRKLQAVPWYEKTIRLNPGQVIAANNLAWILATEKGELAHALKLTEDGVRQAPAYVDLIDTRGYVLMRMGRYEQAAAEFEKCLQMYIDKSPKRTSSLFYLSQCLIELKKTDQAEIELLRTKRLQEENGGLTPQQQRQLEASIQKLTGTQHL